MPIAAIVFDMDGVLIDTEPIWEEVRRAYVDELDGRWLPDTQDRFMGMSTAEWSEYTSRKLIDGRRTPDEVASDVIARMAARYAEQLPLMPDAVETVRSCAESYTLGLASSSPRRLIDVVLDHMGYLEAAARLGIEPDRCVAIEDSSNGLRAAHAAGMTVIAVPHSKYPPAPDALALAAFVAGDLSEITPARMSEFR
ncbi:HAD family phosphatase [Nocardia yunnanensis]|uniref:HAD family phosphatase n=1 Tax=Nocardia yunnanensis TaxID=2382165 RepID=A0A386ZN76_9NOCA|nr:HAD family phosphatase [Nocardia yunnanensis]AYF79091.1 HAD family phosphatase [Nocardia yunnanensis]